MVSTSVSMSYQKIKTDFQFQTPARKKELKLLTKNQKYLQVYLLKIKYKITLLTLEN